MKSSVWTLLHRLRDDVVDAGRHVRIHDTRALGLCADPAIRTGRVRQTATQQFEEDDTEGVHVGVLFQVFRIPTQLLGAAVVTRAVRGPQRPETGNGGNTKIDDLGLISSFVQ